ncbi:MAG: hypothetical protein QM503_09025 [Bacteroidota bacterium]
MKNINLIIAVFLILNITSFAVASTGDDDRMQIDAYAKANIECEYKLAKLEYSMNSENSMVKAQLNELKADVTTFRQKMFKRYSDVDNLRSKFSKLVEASSDKLTTCKKLTALEQSIADEKAAIIKAEEEKAKESK